jgi:hypothetical protein
LRIISRFKHGDDAIRAERPPPDAANTMTWFGPKFVRNRRRNDTPGLAFRTLRLCLGRAPDRQTKVFGRAAPKPVGPSLDRLLEIALEVRRAGDKPGVRGRGGPALAELRFLGVVSTKLRAKVLSRGRAPKFNVAVAGTERLSAEHAAARAGVDDIPAAREHRNLPAE